MANGNMICPIRGEQLMAVPGTCACGRFWMSMADVEAERRASRPEPPAPPQADSSADPPGKGVPPGEAVPVIAHSEGEGCPECGGPPPRGGACEFCGWRPPETGSAAASPVCLVVEGQALELPRDVPVSLGRGTAFRQVNSLLSGFLGISREHAEVLVDGTHVQLRDMDSRNGTYIDGRELGAVEVRRPLPLRFRLGMSVEAEIRAAEQRDDLRRWTGTRG